MKSSEIQHDNDYIVAKRKKRKTFLQQSETFVSSKSMCWKKSRRKLWLLRDHEIRSRRENRVLGIFLSSAVFLFIYLFTVLKKDENADCSYSEHFVSWRIRWYNRVSFFRFFFSTFISDYNILLERMYVLVAL